MRASTGTLPVSTSQDTSPKGPEGCGLDVFTVKHSVGHHTTLASPGTGTLSKSESYRGKGQKPTEIRAAPIRR
jgi:hypothetical protein